MLFTKKRNCLKPGLTLEAVAEKRGENFTFDASDTYKAKGMTGIGRSRNVQTRKLHESVAELLLDDIKNGVYQVGQELPSERALMEEFGVGRPAVRESMAKLARIGVLEIKHGMRSKVRSVTIAPLLNEMDSAVKMSLLTRDGQRHLQQLRLLFETAVVRAIAKTVTDEQLKAIEGLQHRSELAIGDVAKFADMDVLFHRALGEAAGNPFITGIFDAFGKWLLDQRLTNFTNPKRPRVALEAHGRILEALKARDPDKAEKAVLAHLEDVHQHYWTVAEKKPPSRRSA